MAGIPRHVILDAIEAGRAAVRAQPFYRAADAAKYFTPPALLEYARPA